VIIGDNTLMSNASTQAQSAMINGDNASPAP